MVETSWRSGDVGLTVVGRVQLAAVVVHAAAGGAPIPGLQFSFVLADVGPRLQRLVAQASNGIRPLP